MKRKYVYIIRIINTKFYKIGISNNVESRLKELNTATPFDMTIVFKKHFKDFHLIENYVQNTFINKHIRGEWFELSVYDVNSIKSFLENLESRNEIISEIKSRLVSTKKHQNKELKSSIIFKNLELRPKTLEINQEWKIIYYAKEKPKDKFKRFSVKGGINRIKNKPERLIYADELKFHIMRALESGYNPFNNNGIPITNYSP
jgi:hypothetical protein